MKLQWLIYQIKFPEYVNLINKSNNKIKSNKRKKKISSNNSNK